MSNRTQRMLASVESVGNRLPDPAMLFLGALVIVWLISWLLAGHTFSVPNQDGLRELAVNNQLSGPNFALFLSSMVKTFTNFAPLGVVLVAMLGVGVAEHTGFINAGLKSLLNLTPKKLLTPMLLLVAIMSHTAADAGYVLVIPLGGIIFYAAGRHPLAGIACAFAGVSGGFSANFIPSGIDPLLQGFTQQAAQILDANREVNPLSNWLFTSVSSILVIAIGWFLTDKVIEPRLANTPIEADGKADDELRALSPAERRGLIVATLAMLVGVLALVMAVWPADSPLRAQDGSVTAFSAPIMQSIIPLIFLLFIIPGTIYGYVAGTVSSHRDVIAGMTQAMQTMAYYL
ncbi:MAG: AbgT family transporter, partial [Pseudomonadales bacterium]|nr:AbgT family transporter [Pseudomonadales bacterium]